MVYNTDLDSESPHPRDEVAPGEASVTTTDQPVRQGILSGWRGLLIGVGLGAAIALLVTRLVPPPAPSADPPAAAAPAAPGQSVSVEAARMGSIARTLSATGTVDARDWVMVKAQATGLQIQQIFAREGQSVSTGQVIARLDDSVLQTQLTEAKAQLSSAQAQLNSVRAQLTSAHVMVQQKRALLKQNQATLAEAESNLRRYQSLAQQGAETRQNLESRSTTAATARESVNVAQTNILSAQADVGKAQADVNRAQAEVQSAIAQIQHIEAQLEQTSVRAPASGILAKREKDTNGKPLKDVQVGDLTGSDPLFYIIGASSLELRANIPEAVMAKVKPGESVQVTSDADPRIRIQGRVREVDPVVNEQTRQAIAKIDLPSDPRLKPGMFLRASVTSQRSQGMIIPAQAVLPQTDGHSIVYLVDSGNIVHERQVEAGVRQPASDHAQAKVEIKAGLKPGDRVVVIGAGFVKDGDHVILAKGN